VALTANSAFYNSATLGNSCRAVVETLRSPLWLGSPGRMSTLAGASFTEAAKQLSCPSIQVSVASTLWTACEWRKQQLPTKRERHGQTSLKLGRGSPPI
jgi:hypothetical protein